jgi:hypothetical protein
MATSVGKYVIETAQDPLKGKVWNVRVYKKGLLRRLVSSDWFLDERQADEFMQQTISALRNNFDAESMQKRKPGWTFSRPVR